MDIRYLRHWLASLIMYLRERCFQVHHNAQFVLILNKKKNRKVDFQYDASVNYVQVCQFSHIGKGISISEFNPAVGSLYYLSSPPLFEVYLPNELPIL